jgi:type IV pilus assembly protein PilV
MKQNMQKRNSQSGIVLLEAMVAILIFSVGLLGVVGLQAAMIKSTGQAKYRADANFVAQEILGEMWSDVAAGGVDMTTYDTHGGCITPVNTTDIASLLPGGCAVVTPSATAGEVNIQVQWHPAGDVLHNYATVAAVTNN